MNRRTPAEWLVDADASARALLPRLLPLLRVRTLRLGGLLGIMTMLLVMFGSQPAMADPGCGNIPVVSGICSDITGTISFATDPTGYIAGQIKDALGSLLGEFSHLIQATTTVDFSNAGFLQTYAIGFGVASVFTIILWLVAVAKRAVAGAGIVEALGESVGFLIASVAVTAFMPLAVAMVVGVVDDATDAALSPMLGNIGAIGTTVTSAWGPVAGMSGGNVLMGIIGILMLVAAAGVWLELVIRAALIYLTLVFGPLVFSGLVDKSLWKHTKKWIGVMAGVILSKYVTLTTLALATGLLANDNSSDVDTCLGIVLTALALFYLAMLAPVTLGRLIPVVGDDMMTAHQARSDASGVISGLPSQMSSAGEMSSGRGGNSGGDAATAEADDEQGDGDGASADISSTGVQSAGGGTGAQAGADEQQGAEGGAGASEANPAEALPAQGSDGVASSAAEAGATEEAAAAAGPIGAAVMVAEKGKEMGEQAVNAAVERSSGGEIQQASASPDSSPGPAQQATADGSGPQQQAQQHLPAQQQTPPPQGGAQDLAPPQPPAPPPSSSQGPPPPPPSGATPA